MNEVVEMKNKSVAVASGHIASGVLSSDVLIPKLLLMQGLSELVSQRKAQMGDIIKSISDTKLGDPETSIEIIPLAIKNVWVNYEMVGNKAVYRGQEIRNALNDDLEWNYSKQGTTWKRVKSIECFVLLHQDVLKQTKLKAGEVPNLDDVILPCVVSFRSTSYPAGKMMATHFEKAATYSAMGIKPWNYYLDLSCKADSNDKGNFFVWSISGKSKPVDSKFSETVNNWAQIVRGSNITVDESDERTKEVNEDVNEDIC